MLNCEDLEFSLKGVSMAASQISMSRHGNKSCCNSAIQCPICPRGAGTGGAEGAAAPPVFSVGNCKLL